MDSRLETGQGLPRHLPTDQRNGRRRWSLGALLAQVFLISVYVAIWNSGKPPVVIAGSLALLLAFSLIYIFQVGRIMQAPIVPPASWSSRLLFLLTLPQFAVLGPDAAALVDLRRGGRRSGVRLHRRLRDRRWRWPALMLLHRRRRRATAELGTGA